jgi:hypothetical protein
MSNSDLVRRYFSAYENKDRKAVEICTLTQNALRSSNGKNCGSRFWRKMHVRLRGLEERDLRARSNLPADTP